MSPPPCPPGRTRSPLSKNSSRPSAEMLGDAADWVFTGGPMLTAIRHGSRGAVRVDIHNSAVPECPPGRSDTKYRVRPSADRLGPTSIDGVLITSPRFRAGPYEGCAFVRAPPSAATSTTTSGLERIIEPFPTLSFDRVRAPATKDSGSRHPYGFRSEVSPFF